MLTLVWVSYIQFYKKKKTLSEMKLVLPGKECTSRAAPGLRDFHSHRIHHGGFSSSKTKNETNKLGGGGEGEGWRFPFPMAVN
jgi:hypothetical protein